MARHIQRSAWSLWVVSLTFFAWWPSSQLFAANGEESKQTKWIGRVTIVSEGSQIYERDSSTVSKVSGSSHRRYLFDKVTISGCGQSGDFEVTQVRRNLTHTEERRSSKENRKELCPPTEEMQKHGALNRTTKGAWPSTVKRPGDSSKSVERKTWKAYTGDDAPALKDLAGLSLRVFPDGTYALGAFSTLYTDHSMDSTQREIDVCNSKTKKKVYLISTGSLKEEASTSISEAKNGSEYVMQTVTQPVPRSLYASATGKSEGNAITGSKVISEEEAKDKDGWRSKTTARWSFRLAEGNCNCFGEVTILRGDVRIGGERAEMGIIAGDLKGVEISTGPKSRVRIDVGENLRLDIGSNSKVALRNPCKTGPRSPLATPESILVGQFWGYVLHSFVADSGPFEVACAPVVGVRGKMYPVPGLDLERTVVASLLPLVVPAAGMTAIDDKYLDVMPKREEMNSAAVVFLVETSAEYVLVESLKGEIRVLDSLGKEEVLGAGEGFLEEWQASERVGGGGTVYIKGNE